MIQEIPKAELHCHIDCVSPEILLRFGKRNNVDLPVSTVEEAKEKLYKSFEDLDEFLEVWLLVMSVIQTEDDYAELVVECAKDAKRQNIIYREGMFTYQAAHESRGIALETVVNGLAKGREMAMEQYGIDIRFIAEIDRTSSSEESTAYVHNISKYRDKLPITAVGLDMHEIGYPAHNHKEAFKLAKEYGFNLTAHAFEGGAEQIWDTLESLDVQRIDHGSQSIEDRKLVKHLAERDLPLTLCPDSDFQLGIHHHDDHPIRELFDMGVKITINSDDPHFFPSDLIDNYMTVAELYNFTEEELISIVRNGFRYNFSGNEYLEQFDKWVSNWKNN